MTIPSLIASLREAREGSQELDRKIYRALGHTLEDRGYWSRTIGGDRVWTERWSLIPYDLPKPLTSSLDAIMGLIREKLPGRHWSVQTTGEPGRDAYSAEISASAPYSFNVICYTAATPALALCIALLLALEPANG